MLTAKLSLLFILALCACTTRATTSTCPDDALITGCTCRQNRRLDSLPELICKEKDVNVPRVIQRLNSHGEILHFESLHWENGEKVELGEYFFGNLTFRQLLIGTPTKFCYVSRIDPKAFFGPIASEVQWLSVRSFELGKDKDLYSAITALKNLEYLAIEGRHLTGVPASAFTPLANCFSMDGCGMTKLKKINFTEGEFETFIHLTRVEQFAFANLPALEEINMSQQDVYYIGDYAFSLTVPNSKRLKIDLSLQWNRKLTPDSFSQYSLADISRPVELDLYGNQFIAYLPEQVFRPFFEANAENAVRLGMKMNCSCEMYWLWSQPEKYRKHFIAWKWLDKLEDDKEHTVQCEEELDLWELSEKQFSQCAPQQQTPVDTSAKVEL